MGKGQIISGGTDGLYRVQVLYNRDRYDAMIVALNAKKTELIENRIPVQTEYDDKSAEVDAVIVELNLLIEELTELYTDLEALQSELSALRDQLAALEQELQDLLDQEPPATPEAIAAKRQEIADKKVEISDKQTEISDKQKEVEEKQTEVEEKQKEANALSFELAILGQQLAEIDLQITSIDIRVQYLEENMPADGTVNAWCADLTEDLTGEVGTVEIPGERLSPYGILQIQPGYEDNADYDQDRDGQLFATIATTPAQAFYNAAMLPGWQKWQPLFRHGTITAIVDGLADVTLEASVLSSQQDLNINQAATIAAVPFEYMSCDGAAFEVGDVALIMFTGQDFTAPKIIGFKEEPKPCEIVIPYLFASENSFDSGGLLLCYGDKFKPEASDIPDAIGFTAEHEIFSPYGAVSDQPTWRYQPFTFESAQIEWQVKEFTDASGLLWDEIKWMTNGGYDWDPTFYESYDDLYTEEKPYYIYNAKTKIIDGDPADYGYPCEWHGEDQIKIMAELNSEVLVAVEYRQWNVGDLVDGWHNEGTSITLNSGCLDQTNTEKYAFTYTSADYVQTGSRVASLCTLTGDVEWSNSRGHFVGLGFNEELPFGGATIIRLYNINGRYVCLFTVTSGANALIGSAVEGGEFTVIDVTDGFLVDGEYKDLFTDERPITFGMIVKGKAL